MVSHVRCIVPQQDGNEGCGSSDGMSIYYHSIKDDKPYQLSCFVCNRRKWLTKEAYEGIDIDLIKSQKDNVRYKYKQNKGLNQTIMINPNQSVIPDDQFLKGEPAPVRGLHKETLAKYGAFVKTVKQINPDGTVQEHVSKHVYPYFDKNGALIAQKVRHVRDGQKGFEALGDKGAWSRIGLFGQTVFPAGSAPRITITEGEIDAMSVFQMLGGRYPSVSISNGAHSVRKQLENPEVYKYLDTFDTIVICFDNDEHGRKATEVLSEIFPGKTRIVNMSLKDANEYLMAGKEEEFVKDCWWKAKEYRPDGLALSSEFMEDVVSGSVAKGAIPYHHKELNRKLFGMRQAEMTCWVAGTGSGKSTMIRELVNHIRLTTPDTTRIGMLMLEESPNKTATGLVGLQLGKPLLLYDLDQQLPAEDRVLRELVITKEEREAAAKEILGSDRFVIMKNSFQGTDLENIVKKVRQMNKVYGCEHIVLDHLSIIVSGQDQGDERKALDAVTTALRRLVEETNVNLHVVSHLKRPDGKGFEDGAEISLSDIRGTAAIAQLSDNVIGLERNQQHEDLFQRNIIKFRVLKCRVTGLTGPAGYGYFNSKTGRIEHLSNEEYEAYVKSYEEQKQEKEQKSSKNGIDFDFKH